MIRNEKEYQEAIKRIEDERARFEEHAAAWKEQGFTDEQIAKLSEPLESFHLQLVEEVESYERLKRGQFKELENLDGLGQMLIGLRIARDLTQREVARRLSVDESVISRYERNEYHGITVDRAQAILAVLGVKLITTVESLNEPESPVEV